MWIWVRTGPISGQIPVEAENQKTLKVSNIQKYRVYALVHGAYQISLILPWGLLRGPDVAGLLQDLR